MDFINKFFLPSTSKFQNIILLLIVIIISILFTVFFILQDISEDSIRKSLFEDQMQNQLDTNHALSEHISSDLELLSTRTEIISSAAFIQDGNYSEPATAKALQNMYNKSQDLIGKSGVIYITDQNGNIQSTYPDSPNSRKAAFINESSTFNPSNYQNIANQSYFNQASQLKKPVFYNGPSTTDNSNDNNNTYRLIISNPIIQENSGNFLGVIGISLSATDFFKRLGNVYDIESSYLAVLDNNATHLVHSNNNLVGRNFFENYTQNFINQNNALNDLMYQVLSGNSGSVVYSLDNLGERLTTGFPIFLNEQGAIPKYVAFIVTPTSQIYNQIEDLLFIQRIQMFLLLTITAASVIILILFLIKWNTKLEGEVAKRTQDLVKSNIHLKDITRQLQTTNDSLLESNIKVKEINEELRNKDKLQKEFINIAAHELRTPVQALVGYSELLMEDKRNIDRYVIAILRNSERLEKLTNNILDTSRIDNNIFHLRKEWFNLSTLVNNVVQDIKRHTINFNKDTMYNNKDNNSNRNIPNMNTGKNNGNNDPQINYGDDDYGNTYSHKNNHDNNYTSSYSGSRANILWQCFVESDVHINADKERITQVISNLCTNAINFTKRGTIYIALKKIKEEAVFEVTDTGPGIDPDILPKIFTKFTTKSASGTGLGLFISKNIIEAHKGKIWARNNFRQDGNKSRSRDANKNSPSNKNDNIHSKSYCTCGATIGFSIPLNSENE